MTHDHSTHSAIDVHTHVVPEKFPAYGGSTPDIPWPSMAPAHACHAHVMISGKVYRTVADGSWSVPRRIEGMEAMRVGRQVLSPMPESPEVYAKKFFYDCVVFDPKLVQLLIGTYGASQIVVGSDYPFAMGELDPIGLLGRCGLDAATVEAITNGNAKRFLGI